MVKATEADVNVHERRDMVADRLAITKRSSRVAAKGCCSSVRRIFVSGDAEI